MNWRGRDPVMRGLAQTTDPSTTCSDGGRSTDSPALKAAVLEQVYEELTADMQEEEEVETKMFAFPMFFIVFHCFSGISKKNSTFCMGCVQIGLKKVAPFSRKRLGFLRVEIHFDQ